VNDKQDSTFDKGAKSMTDVLFNQTQFLASLADDEELAQELLAAFFQDSPQRTSELREAIDSGDALTASKLAHSLKGMCGVVRAERLSELALSMERLSRDGDMDQVKTNFDLFVAAHRETTDQMNAYMNH
jgi:HPt (histidine-containing phosphotransfer) domain-containing protein